MDINKVAFESLTVSFSGGAVAAERMRPVRLEPHLDFSCRGSASLDFGMNISGGGAIEAREARISLGFGQ